MTVVAFNLLKKRDKVISVHKLYIRKHVNTHNVHTPIYTSYIDRSNLVRTQVMVENARLLLFIVMKSKSRYIIYSKSYLQHFSIDYQIENIL